MTHICDYCMLNKGCAFSLTTKGIIKCRDHIDTGLDKETKQGLLKRMEAKLALTANDIQVE